MFKSFFKARDAWDAELLSEETRRSGERSIQTPYALFRVLLEHTIFDQKSPAYGWVAEGKNKITSQETLGKLMGITRRQTIARALSDLEEMYLIQRYRMRNGEPGSPPDRIKIIWEPMWAEEEDTESDTDSTDSERAESAHQTESAPCSTESALSRERAESALSYTSKKGLEELQKHNAGERSSPGDSAPSREPSKIKPSPLSASPTSPSGEALSLARKKILREIEELFPRYVRCWSSRGEDEAARIARGEINRKSPREALRDMREAIRENESPR